MLFGLISILLYAADIFYCIAYGGIIFSRRKYQKKTEIFSVLFEVSSDILF